MGIIATALHLLLLIAFSATAAEAQAQALQGRIIDAETEAPIAGARVVVRSSVDLNRGESNADGRFNVPVRRAGSFQVEVSHVDYIDMRTLTVEIPQGEVAQVVIRLSSTVVQGDTLIVVGTARDRYHEATFEGAMARRRQLPDYGFRRVVTQEDPELANAFSVSEVLRYFPPAGCTTIFMDGRVVPTQEWRDYWLNTSASMVEAVEFYRRPYQAPRAFRPEAEAAGSPCAVLALWSRRTPSQTRRPLLKLIGTVGASALLVLLLR